MAGTGLPQLKSSPVLAEAPKFIDGDQFSSANAWGKIAAAAETLSKTAGNLDKLDVLEQQAKATADFELKNTRDINDLRDKYEFDPQGFDNAATAHMEGAVGGVPPWLANHAQKFLGQKIESTRNVILHETRSRNQLLAGQSLEARRMSAEGDALVLADAGKIGTPAWDAAIQTYNGVLDTAVATGRMAPEKADFLRDDLIGKAQSSNAGRVGVQIYKEQGEAAAIDYLQKNIKENDQLSMKATTREKAFNAGLRAINLQKQMDRQDRVGIVQDAQDVISRLKAGVPVDDGEVRDTLDAAARVGAWSVHRQLSIENGVRQNSGALRSGASLATRGGIIATARDATVSIDDAASRIKAIESSGNYASLGPVTKSGDRAYGAYQVMGENVGPWTEKWVGRRMTPQEFVADKAAQDKVFQGQFGMYMQKYGAAGAAAAWFAGEGGMNNPNARDSLGTTVQGYVNKFAGGSGGAGAGPNYDAEIVRRLQGQWVDDAKRAWPEAQKAIKTGNEVDPDDFNAIRAAAHLSGDPKFINEVEEAAVTRGLGQQMRDLPLSDKQAFLDQAKSQFNDSVVGALQKQVERSAKMLKDDQIGYAIDDGVKPPDPLNVADQRALRAGLAQRAQIVQAVAQKNRVPVGSALRDDEMTSIQAALQSADPAGKARIFSDLATLPENVRMATLAKMGAKGTDAMVEAFAGALYSRDPSLGASILQGQAALKDERFNPTKGDGNKKIYERVLTESMPASAFAPEMRVNETGALAVMRKAANARYAFLAASAGDDSGHINENRMKQAINDVTGGVLKHNGGFLISPAPGMPQATFDRVMTGLKDSDLADVTTLSGEKITADYIRNSAKLVSVGQGRYLVQVNSNSEKPMYAAQGANTELPSRFILDLRGRENQLGPTRPIDTGLYDTAVLGK